MVWSGLCSGSDASRAVGLATARAGFTYLRYDFARHSLIAERRVLAWRDIIFVFTLLEMARSPP